MDAFEYAETQEAAHTPRKTSGLVWNILTVLVLLSTLCVGGIFVSIFLNPNSAINPFPPPVLPTQITPPTPTPTSRSILPPTWTPTPTSEPTSTNTPRPTFTPMVSETETPVDSEMETPEPDTTPVPGGMSFIVQQDGIKALPNIYHVDQGCNWQGVGGYVLDLRGSPLNSQIVWLGGSLGGENFNQPTLTDNRGYFEFFLADKPIDSQKTLWVQLVEQNLLPMSEKVYIDTYDDCEKNLVIVYFSQVR